MKKVGRTELRKIIMNEIKYTHSVIDDRGDGGYGVKVSDRGSLGLEARNALNSIGVDYMDETGTAFDGDDSVSRVIMVQRMTEVGQVELILFYKGQKVASAYQGQREAFIPLNRYRDAHDRSDFQRMIPAQKALAAELQLRYSNNPLAMELVQSLQGPSLQPLLVTDFNSYSR